MPKKMSAGHNRRNVLKTLAGGAALGSVASFSMDLNTSLAARTPQGGVERLHINVWDKSGVNGIRPVTGGMPLPQGAAPAGAVFALADERSTSVPVQATVLAQWKDGSARWVLLDFQSNPPSNGMAHYALSWGSADAVRPRTPVQAKAGKTPYLQTGKISLKTNGKALLNVSDRMDIELTLVLADGSVCAGVMESAGVEMNGPVRSTMAMKGSFQTASGKRVFGFRLRASLFAGLSKIFIEPQIIIDAESGVVQKIRELKLDMVSRKGVRSASIGGEPVWSGSPAQPVRLFQVDDEQYRMEGASGKGGKAPGWAAIDDGSGTVSIALRDFWQQWPKDITVEKNGVSIGLFPLFESGAFSHMEPWYKYDYLFEGNCYRLRQGQSRRWQIWLDLSGEGANLSRSANAPLVPSADPAEAIATGVWGYIAPAASKGMDQYDAWVENLFDNGYLYSIIAQRDYGAMNWGDWFGERQCNWGNHEYDTAKHILVQFARTGDPKYFYTGDTAARHVSEVDTVHALNDDLNVYFKTDAKIRDNYPLRPGMVHQHCIGHVGGFYPVEKVRELFVSFGIERSENPYLCLEPTNLGHIWTQGMVYDYFLTGDPWMKETIEKIGDNLARLVEDRVYNFKTGTHVGRTNGWPMQALAGAYELEFDDRFLKAMRMLAEDAMSSQDPHCGGWIWVMAGGGHCNCITNKHVGEAGFIGSIRINGLSRYYELTGDERIPPVIERGITHLNNDTWKEERSGWRYTSCPASNFSGQTGVTVAALVNSVKLTHNEEHLRILKKAWDEKFKRYLVAPSPSPGFGKNYTTIMYGCPEAMNLFVNGLK